MAISNEDRQPERELVIRVVDVHKRFKDVKAVDGVSLEVETGEFVGLLGPNGAGKTTLVEMIEGIRRPDSGEIAVLGRHWRTDERYLRGVMGISLQETNFIDKLTARETLELFAGFYGIGRDRSDSLIELVGMQKKRDSYTMNLSHGQRQKLALAIALLNHPRILILDEPTTGLDPNARREIWGILKGLKKQGTALLITTHYMDEAEALCDRIVIMNEGRVLVEGTIENLLPSGEQGVLPIGEGAVWKRMNLDDLFVSLTGRHLHE
ncbi:MAG TPA: ABC transporter ATP-binding protein [Candidatus Eisenbacteria bacterium]|uniref:ABC transporter ATP-binding protein n=1 Tax=Eiseniibacteriota bacterium TaxID=2212470 RepID=A0A7V2AUY0_UNCEI|nr:ABC transporter ATP-binding protein [Candidatus Eisenbacteria bacterium]